MRSKLVLLTATVTLAACGGGPPGPVALAYTLPDPAALTYLSGDTILVEIDAGGQAFQVRQNSAATYGLAFARADDGLRVTLTVEDFAGSASNPLGAPTQVDEGDIEGPLVFTLDRLGNVAIVSRPEVGADAGMLFGPSTVAFSFFPGLPGRAAAIGDTWTDTVQYDGTQDVRAVQALSILQYTVVGDTALAGRSLLRLDVSGTMQQTASGTMQGIDFSQDFSGPVTGTLLWDTRHAVLYERDVRSDLRGTMEVSMAPFPLDVRVRVRARAILQS